MRFVKLRTDMLDPARATPDKWYVTNGVNAVGPVDTHLLTKGIAAGKVPMDAFIRHVSWKVWKPLEELAVITDDSDGSPSLPPDAHENLPELEAISLASAASLASSDSTPERHHVHEGYYAIPLPTFSDEDLQSED